MKMLLKVANIFFVVLGVIFFFVIIFAIWFYIADPYQLKGLFFAKQSVQESGQMPNSANTTPGKTTGGASGTTQDLHPNLTAEQETILLNVGIDPSTLPNEMTPEMETCLYQALGQDRAQAIVNGSSPTPLDVLKAGHCLNAQ